MINYTHFFSQLADTPLATNKIRLIEKIESALDVSQNSNLEQWQHWLNELPEIKPDVIDLNSSAIKIGSKSEITDTEGHQLKERLKKFHPWRKGPYSIFGIEIDTEWRSDLKWDRLKNHIRPLKGNIILDVGCGNGYHCWRMVGAGAKMVIGLEPYLLSVMQFRIMQTFIQSESLEILPLGIEDLPMDTAMFDTVFSMGVFYHRRSPMDHLMELRGQLKSGGELILETLVIEGGNGHVLVPETRYAKMGNVWFIPSALTLESWLRKCKYKNIRIIDITKTTPEEQRPTEWMEFESLPQYLNSQNDNLTIEGYPAPQRAIFLAEAP